MSASVVSSVTLPTYPMV